MISIFSNLQKQIRSRSLTELSPFAILALISALLLGLGKIVTVIASGIAYSLEAEQSSHLFRRNESRPRFGAAAMS